MFAQLWKREAPLYTNVTLHLRSRLLSYSAAASGLTPTKAAPHMSVNELHFRPMERIRSNDELDDAAMRGDPSFAQTATEYGGYMWYGSGSKYSSAHRWFADTRFDPTQTYEFDLRVSALDGTFDGVSANVNNEMLYRKFGAIKPFKIVRLSHLDLDRDCDKSAECTADSTSASGGCCHTRCRRRGGVWNLNDYHCTLFYKLESICVRIIRNNPADDGPHPIITEPPTSAPVASADTEPPASAGTSKPTGPPLRIATEHFGFFDFGGCKWDSLNGANPDPGLSPFQYSLLPHYHPTSGTQFNPPSASLHMPTHAEDAEAAAEEGVNPRAAGLVELPNEVTVRLAQDPFVKAQYITSGTLNFGPSLVRSQSFPLQLTPFRCVLAE